MRVRVRLFAALRELAGADHVELDLPDGSDVRELRRRLASAAPSLGAHLTTSRLAASLQFVSDGHVVQPGEELALIPPVSGG